MPAAFLAGGAGAVIVAVFAAFGDRRRTRRADLDRVGFVDWRGLQLAALVTAAICVSIGLNLR